MSDAALKMPKPGRRARLPVVVAAPSSRTVGGDADAFAALYTEHHQALYRYCRAILRHDEDARDALQSTMTKAYAALRTEQRDFELVPWLFRIARNESITILRGRRESEDAEALASLAGLSTVEQEVAQRSEIAQLREDLRDLPELQRSALVLRELNGLGHEEIAAVLGSTPRAVKQTIFEARTALHEFAAGHAMGCEAIQQALSDGDGRVLRGRRMRAHMRSCHSCRAFKLGLSTRPNQLAMLAPPLPLAAASALLGYIITGTAHSGFIASAGGAGVAGGAGASAVAGSAGVMASGGGATIGAGILGASAGKAALVLAVAAVTAGGAVGAVRLADRSHTVAPRTGAAQRPGAASSSTLRGLATPAWPGGAASPNPAGPGAGQASHAGARGGSASGTAGSRRGARGSYARGAGAGHATHKPSTPAVGGTASGQGQAHKHSGAVSGRGSSHARSSAPAATPAAHGKSGLATPTHRPPAQALPASPAAPAKGGANAAAPAHPDGADAPDQQPAAGADSTGDGRS